MVKINAQPDDKGLIKDKVSKLIIVTPTTEDQPMLPDLGGKPKGKPAKPAPRASADDFKGAVGMIVGVHPGKLSIKIEKKLSEVELAEDAKVEVSVDIVTWAAKGDKIHAAGLLNPRSPGLCLAKDVSITLSEPLTSGRKRSAVAKADTAAKTDSADKAATGDAASTKKKDAKKKPADSDDNK